MEPIKFYPEKSNLTKGLVFGVVLFALGQGVGDTVGTLMIFAGLIVAGMSGYAMAKPSPCFEADAEGFSVMGKAKRPWSEYRGAGIHVMRYGFVPVGRWAYVQVGKRALTSRKLYIKWTHLPYSPKETAARIDAVAALAARGAFAQAVPEPIVEPVHDVVASPLPAMQRPARSTPAPSDGGPIRTTRGLFGRSRKVI